MENTWFGFFTALYEWVTTPQPELPLRVEHHKRGWVVIKS
jgi:hypothetical protein